MINWRDLLHDEKGKASAARTGLWITVALAILTIGCDVYLTLLTKSAFRIPNTVYSLEGTMFMAFASWAGGPRIAAYLGPQTGQVAAGIASAIRDVRLPSKDDDERGAPDQ